MKKQKLFGCCTVDINFGGELVFVFAYKCSHTPNFFKKVSTLLYFILVVGGYKWLVDIKFSLADIPNTHLVIRRALNRNDNQGLCISRNSNCSPKCAIDQFNFNYRFVTTQTLRNGILMCQVASILVASL